MNANVWQSLSQSNTDKYLNGYHFTVVTYCSSLQWLFNFKNPRGRVHRWSICLLVYDLIVKHRPGAQMLHVDALLRAPVNILITNAAILEAQRKADLRPINKQIVHNDIIYYINITNTTKFYLYFFIRSLIHFFSCLYST
jgi:hypothetical protein